MTHPQCSRPHVGIGVLLVNPDGHVLIGKRKGPHAPYWSIPEQLTIEMPHLLPAVK